MTDDPTSDHPRRFNPDRRTSPFDQGFVTLWKQNESSASNGTPRTGGPAKADGYLPDAWGDGDQVGATGQISIDTDSDPGEPDGEPDDEPDEPEEEPVDEPVDIAIDALRSDEAQQERAAANEALRPVVRSLEASGLYAYITLDDENRWTVASDDEQGRVDVRLDDGDYEVVLAATSPGMYADEANAYRRKSLERLARMLIPRVARGYLADHQKASWDDVEAGVAVRVRYVLPRAEPEAIGPFVREHFEELEELLSFVEEQINR